MSDTHVSHQEYGSIWNSLGLRIVLVFIALIAVLTAGYVNLITSPSYNSSKIRPSTAPTIQESLPWSYQSNVSYLITGTSTPIASEVPTEPATPEATSVPTEEATLEPTVVDTAVAFATEVAEVASETPELTPVMTEEAPATLSAETIATEDADKLFSACRSENWFSDGGVKAHQYVVFSFDGTNPSFNHTLTVHSKDAKRFLRLDMKIKEATAEIEQQYCLSYNGDLDLGNFIAEEIRIAERGERTEALHYCFTEDALKPKHEKASVLITDTQLLVSIDNQDSAPISINFKGQKYNSMFCVHYIDYGNFVGEFGNIKADDTPTLVVVTPPKEETQ